MVRAATSGLALCAVLVAALVPASANAAPTVPAGYDLLQTSPEVTRFKFEDEFTLPAGFFAPGSEAFTGTVRFGGVPIRRFQGKDVGATDTVIERKEAAPVTTIGSSATVPIQLRQLSIAAVAPIVVRVSGMPQKWDVKAAPSPSRPSAGQLTIRRKTDEGGTFDSSIEVFPALTFTRRTDGMQRKLDVGALPLSEEALKNLRFQANNTNWIDKCPSSVFVVEGLNDSFCPGHNTEVGSRQAQPIYEFPLPRIPNAFDELAALAAHEVIPAPPMLENFTCWNMKNRTPFRARGVRLIDQFSNLRVRVIEPRELCNPVAIDGRRLTNDVAHLQCYRLADTKFKERNVDVWNQFGAQRLKVLSRERLCVPSTKRKGTKKAGLPLLGRDSIIDHFECYSVESVGGFKAATAKLRDQFDDWDSTILRPVWLCNPAQKNDEPLRDYVQHLVCYRLQERHKTTNTVATRDQFGSRVLDATVARRLCVRSNKAA